MARQDENHFTVMQVDALTHWHLGDVRVILKSEISDHMLQINSLASGRSEFDSKNVIFNLALLIGIFRSSHDHAFWWMPQDLTDDKSTLVQVMAWCRQATSHYLSQCWFSSLLPYGVARPKWVKFKSTSCGIALRWRPKISFDDE